MVCRLEDGGVMVQRLLAIFRKEFTQTLRDRRTLTYVLVLPVVLLFLFGYAVEIQVHHIPTVVADASHDQHGWAFLEAMETSSFFDIEYYVESEAEAIRAIDEGRVRAAIVIPPGFAAAVERGEAQVLVVVDGSDAMTVQSAFNAAITVGEAHAVALLAQQLSRSGVQGTESALVPLDVRTRVLYNPDVRSLVFMVPGMLGLILQQQTVMLTAMAIVRERELGTIEQLLVTPIRPWELMLGKILPNVAIASLNMCTILALGVFWFGVPFNGSVLLFVWLTLLFMFSGLGLGILVSTVSNNQRQAQQLTSMIMLPGMMLSGYIFPRSQMPTVVQWAGNLLPVTHFLQIARGIMTKGVGLHFVQSQVIVLLIYGATVFSLSALSFRERLE
jgi:ABC-2 type transport system permease protein